MGDDTPPPVDPSKPNTLTFQSVSEEDLGYYRCEVKEAGRVVLIVYRALYKEIPDTSCVDTSLSGECTSLCEVHAFVGSKVLASIATTSHFLIL